MAISKNTDFIKQTAQELGFEFCGISKADFLEEDAINLEKWLQNGYHGKMQYMENHFDKRVDPRKLVPGAKSVISLMYNYYPAQKQIEDIPKVSKYAFGKDYHFTIKDKLKLFFAKIEAEIGNIEGRVFVDSAPVMERAWAARSGLGWIGKHSLLINKKAGSFFFIAEIISDLALNADAPTNDYCGTCTACIDACPTNAIVANSVIDANKCIPYLTIELKDNISSAYINNLEGWAFGCDICQDVCPWNRFSKAHQETQFKPHDSLLNMPKEEWIEMTRETFNEIFRKSAVKRAGYAKFMQNLGED